MLKGTISIIPKGHNLERITDLLDDFVKAVNEIIIDQLDTELANHLIESLVNLIQILLDKQEKGVDVSLIHKYSKDFFYMIIRALGVYNNFRLLGKGDPENIAT
jgi:hypothetical protein